MSIDKLKFFDNVWPIVFQRKSSSSGKRSLNLRLLKIIHSALYKIFEMVKCQKRNVSNATLEKISKSGSKKFLKIISYGQTTRRKVPRSHQRNFEMIIIEGSLEQKCRLSLFERHRNLMGVPSNSSRDGNNIDGGDSVAGAAETFDGGKRSKFVIVLDLEQAVTMAAVIATINGARAAMEGAATLATATALEFASQKIEAWGIADCDGNEDHASQVQRSAVRARAT